MKAQNRLTPSVAALGAWFLGAFFTLPLPAQPPKTTDPLAAATDEEREAHLARTKKVATEIRLLADPGNPETAVTLIETPVVRYNDQTRLTYDSSL